RSDRLGLDRVPRRQRDRAADHRLAVGLLRPAPLFRRLDCALHGRVVHVRQCRFARGAGLLADHPGTGRRGAPLNLASHSLRGVSARRVRHRDGDLRRRRDGRAHAGTDGGRLDHRYVRLAVDLRILKSRQLAVGVVFGLVLGVCLYATVFVLPVYLQNVRQFTANQTGLVILPGALASAFTMAFMGRLQGKFDGRLSIAAGVGIFALSMWKHAHFTTESGMSDFFWPLIFRGVGLGLIFVPLTNLALADLPMSKIPNGTGLFNLMRQLGGSVGIAISATLVQRFTAIHRADLIANVTQFSEVTRERLAG